MHPLFIVSFYSPEKQDKVKEEVRALANLNHLHIVRYFSSWMEKAPDGWKEKPMWSELTSSDSVPLSKYMYVIFRSSKLCLCSNRCLCIDLFTYKLFFRTNTLPTDPPPSGPSELKILKFATKPPPTCLFIQTELCKEATLRTWLHETSKKKNRTKIQVLRFFKQVRLLYIIILMHILRLCT